MEDSIVIVQFIHSFIHSFTKYMCLYFAPYIVLGRVMSTIQVLEEFMYY